MNFPTLAGGIDAIKNEFFGLVKVDMTPPADLFVPLLPDRVDGKLLFT